MCAIGCFAAALAPLGARAQETSPQLTVRADNSPGTVVEQTAATGPITIITPAGGGSGGTSEGSGTANYGFLKILARASTTGGDASHSLFGAQGSAKFADRVTISAPGREGTRGRVLFKARYFGRVQAQGVRARATIQYQAKVGECCAQGALAQRFTVEADAPQENYNFLGEQPGPVFSGEFVFGVPFTVGLEISGSAFAYPDSPQLANVEIGASWQGVVAVLDTTSGREVTGFTVASQSGANYAQPITSLTPGPQPDSADLLVSATGTANPVVDGQHVTYRTTVRNAGPNTASGIQGSVVVPNGTFVSTTLPPGSFTRLGTYFNINLGDLPGGGEVSFEIVVSGNQPVTATAAQELKFVAAFSSNAIDPNASDNATTVITEFAGPPPVPRYHIDRVIEPPSDYSPQNGTFRAKAVNAAGYVAFDYRADTTQPPARITPLIFKSRNEPFLELTWPGELNPPAGESPNISHISDLASDGSFWVVGTYTYARSDSNLNFRPKRGVAWRVDAAGRSTVYRLDNLYTSVNGNPPSEEQDAFPVAINSAGVAVGYGQQTSALGTQVHVVGIRWNLPSVMAQRLSTESIRIGSGNDVDKQGNFVGSGFFEDRSFVGGFYNLQPLPMVSGRPVDVEAIANGRLTGSYSFYDSDGPNGPFVYTVGEPVLRRLPKPAGTLGDISTGSSGDRGRYINAAGDVVGTASNPPSIGNSNNPGFQVLWKRRDDGSYRVHTLGSILQQNGKDISSYPFPEFLGITADGSILMKTTNRGVERAFFLRAGARPTDQPLNISTRLRVQPGEKVLIGGMIVTGVETKRVVIRAIGPSLADAGVSGVLNDPVLDLFENQERLITIDDWREAEFQFEPGGDAAGFEPTREQEAAYVADLVPGVSYTAIVRGKGEESGVALVEVYDISQGTDAKLANISTRGFVETGEDIMIAGFILGGQGSKVLVRALGPSLGDAGLQNVLQDPTLHLFDAQGTPLTSNDDWQSGQPDQLPQGFAPAHPTEAALVATLPAGPYTAVVRGKNATGAPATGLALVEVYDLR